MRVPSECIAAGVARAHAHNSSAQQLCAALLRARALVCNVRWASTNRILHYASRIIAHRVNAQRND